MMAKRHFSSSSKIDSPLKGFRYPEACFGVVHSPTNYRKRKSSLVAFFKHFLAHPEIPREPRAYFDIRNRPKPLFCVPGNRGRQTMMILRDFLNDTMIQHCSYIDEHGYPILRSGFSNPIIQQRYYNVNKGETHRDIMPGKLVNLAIQILINDNFAWPKRIGKFQDNFRWKNPETGLFENKWSPVRTYALLVKLMLPVRSYQVRVLDSGEGDTYRYQTDGKWVINDGNHRPEERSIVEHGVFRKFIRKDNSEGAVLYFNTNKTADIDSSTKGYIMPWEKKDALRLLAELRDWQEKYNPVISPTPWSEVSELKKEKHRDDLKRMGHSYFLFRDPTHSERPDFPLTDVRLRKFWYKVLEEIENRLAASGETLSDGSPIKLLISKTKKDGPYSPLFDLHSLRVTMITALYQEGVPPELLMKIVGQ